MISTELHSLTAKLRPANLRDSIQNFFVLTAGVAIMIINFNLLIAPGEVAPGGLGGLALIINQHTGIAYGTIMLALSIPLIALGYWQLGRMRFLVRSVYATLLYTVGVDATARFFPPEGVIHDMLLTAVFGGILGGIGFGLVLRAGGIVSGTRIISRVLQVRTGIPLSQLYVLVNSLIIIGMGMVFGWENALYSVVMLFMLGLATDYLMEGPSVVKIVFIVTDKPDQVGVLMISKFKIGVTRWTGEGLYTGKDHAILFCTVTRPDVEILREAIREVDPEAFVAIAQGHQASGGVVKPGAAAELPEVAA